MEQLYKLTDPAGAWVKIAPALPIPVKSVGVIKVLRFFVSPYNPNLIYLLDVDGVKRSDNGGASWQTDSNLQEQLTWSGQIPISANDDHVGLNEHFDMILTDMKFDPGVPLLRFAVGQGGVCMTIDGTTWTRLLHTGALPGRPSCCYFDGTSPSSPSLYVAFAGRSLMRISEFQTSQLF
jgi:hypothetical protein